MTKISVEHEFLFRILEPATQDPTVMEWPLPFSIMLGALRSSPKQPRPGALSNMIGRA